MIYLFFAHHNEARPFIERLKLKKDMSFHHCELFRAEPFVLGVMGIGKVKAAISVSLICSYMTPSSDSRVFNLGIAGGDKSFSIGDLVFINKVVDTGNDRNYYPDVIDRHGLQEGALQTVDKPILNAVIEAGLVDMEGAGFFEASLRFFTQDRIQLMKIVSDHGLGVNVARENVEGLMRGRMDKILEILDV